MCSILGSTSDRKDIKVNGQALKPEMFDTTSKVQLQADIPQSEKDGVRLEMVDSNYTIPTTRGHRLQR